MSNASIQIFVLPIFPSACCNSGGKSGSGHGIHVDRRTRHLAGFFLCSFALNCRCRPRATAEYGKTGLVTFIVNHYGDVYEKNLSRATTALASKITAYAPDATWNRIDE